MLVRRALPRSTGLVLHQLPNFRQHIPVRAITAASMDKSVEYNFGPYKIRGDEVFCISKLSFAFVNLKPVVPGHILICPLRVVKRFQELAPEEVADMWSTAQRVGSKLEPHYGADSLTMAIQDGPSAGQTVPHVHIHVLPRKPGDFAKNDEVYDAIDRSAKSLPQMGSEQQQQQGQQGEPLDLDAERRVRTPDEMAAEAAELRQLFL
ncbi:HIT-like protein [Dunaliella salina]|uniref:HIT-like protein n=1 Tax=Dunaliella salina TaxID=3046 RepID=A0ABQ7H7N6_DUNSA|nr:HIT-like protein [Dunaliella salina]|eukprot:KAF5842862.1 HIT-like protein [Dunaliella salina]